MIIDNYDNRGFQLKKWVKFAGNIVLLKNDLDSETNQIEPAKLAYNLM
jgi:hypothetical protein